MFDEERVTLAFKQFAAQRLVGEEILMDLDVRVQREVFGQLLFQLRAKVLSDDLPPEHFTARQRVAYEVPASTWQMWKKRHAHRWYARHLVARWPVRYEPDPDGRGTDAVCTFDLERYRLYPRARVQLPPERFGVEVLAHSIRDVRWALGEDV
ncbi:hypothetical protein ME763_32045 [Streptomyces murinus]|uniref:hypothetical protein n=1 Tax=Streptomyces murinus TaxID=33900 RepID=UPI000A1FF6F3|nr:hypothetical protein [Streptomyces murinus]WDO09924.1 hypothetical protein ME763_32045 [Streptomyces murinus]